MRGSKAIRLKLRGAWVLALEGECGSECSADGENLWNLERTIHVGAGARARVLATRGDIVNVEVIELFLGISVRDELIGIGSPIRSIAIFFGEDPWVSNV